MILNGISVIDLVPQVPTVVEAAAEAPRRTAESYALTPAGWGFMLTSIAFVVILTFWCFKRVLSAPPAED